MHTPRLLVAFALTLGVSTMTVAIAARGAQSQSAQTAPADLVSSGTGVYTDAQATRGEATFATTCTGCHTADTYTQTSFRNNWGGGTVWELFSYMSDTMPEDAPGSLAPADYAEVLAYFLKLNRVPAGQADLPSGRDALSKIRLDFGAMEAAPPRAR